MNPDATADCSQLSRLMTCMLVLEHEGISVTDYITPKENSTSSSGRYELLTSNQYMVDHLIKSVILCNADNAARLLASVVSPNSEYFVSLMNEKARELGMSSTYFTSPDGAADNTQRTTVNDMCRFFSYAVNNQQFRNAASSPVAHIWGGTAVVNESRMLRNAVFDNSSITAGIYTVYGGESRLSTTIYYITTGASNTELPQTRLILAMSGVSDDISYDLGVSYIENALTNFTKAPIVSKNSVITTVNTESGELTLVANESIYCMMPADVTNYIDNISYNITVSNNGQSPYGGGTVSVLTELTPPIEKGSVIGTANYLLKDGSVHAVTIVAGNSIRSENEIVNVFYKTIQENTDIFLIISVLVLFEIILIVFISVGKIRRRRASRR